MAEKKWGSNNGNQESPTGSTRQWGSSQQNSNVTPITKSRKEKTTPDNGNNFNNFNQTPKGGNGKSKLFVSIGVGVVLLLGGITATAVYKNHAKQEVKQVTASDELREINAMLKSGNVTSYPQYVTDSFLGQEWEYFNKNKGREDFFKKVVATLSFKLGGNETPSITSIDIEHVNWNKVAMNMEDYDFKKIQDMYNQKGIKKEDYMFKDKMIDLFAEYIVKTKKLPVKTSKLPVQLGNKNGVLALEDDKAIDKTLFSSKEFHNALDVFGGIATGDIGTLEENPKWVAWGEKTKNLEAQLKEEEKKLEEINAIINDSEKSRDHAESSKGKAEQSNGKADKSANGTGQSDAKANESGNGTDESLRSADESSNGTDNSEGGTHESVDEADKSNDKAEESKGKADKSKDKTYALSGVGVKNPELNTVNSIKNQLAVLKDNEPLKTHVKRKSEPNPKWEEWNKLDDAGKQANKEPEKEIVSKLKPQANVPYTWVGSYYLQNEFEVNGKKVVVKPQVGDGTFKRPLGLGTPIVTKMKGTDNQYYDVRVTLLGYKTNQKAIDYAVSFDERNRGFDAKSELSLMTVEYTVENLTDKEIELHSEFTLSDANENLVSRTGNMYNFVEKTTFKGHETKKMQDWFYTKSLKDRYLIWGKSFERKHPSQWYNVLKGAENEKNGGVKPENKQQPKQESNQQSKDN
ncbi:hypothetical protein P9X10_00910 [Bacillus cereus]|nr:hypothetical protein [Bacillus cereus]